MTEFLKALFGPIWKWIGKLSRWQRTILIVIVLLASAEVGQDGFLGAPTYWVAARLVPWPQLFAPAHSVAATYSVARQAGEPFAPLGVDAACPLGSKVHIEYSRSGNGWVALAGWNLTQGLYSISESAFEAIPIEEKSIHSQTLDMTSSAGREHFIVASSGKPFDAKRVFDEVARMISNSEAVASKGGRAEIPAITMRHIEFGAVGTCESGASKLSQQVPPRAISSRDDA